MKKKNAETDVPPEARVKAATASREPQFPWPRSKVANEAAKELNWPFQNVVEASGADEIQHAIEKLNSHPDVIAKRLIEQALQTVHLDPRVHRDAPWLSGFVMLMREMLADHVPGMTLVETLAPLQTALSQYGGGRKPNVDAETVVRVQSRLKQNWHPAPTQETANKLDTSARNVRKILEKNRKQKPG